MHTQSLPGRAWAHPAAAVHATLLAAWQRWLEQRARSRALRRAERELAEMSLHGLRDIGASEALLARRQRQLDVPRFYD